MKHLCIQCEERFRTSEELEVHQRSNHGKKQFFCSQCKTCFVESRQLKSHIRTHNREKGYDCLQFGKDFKTLQKLQTHILMKRHLGAPSVKSPFHYLVT